MTSPNPSSITSMLTFVLLMTFLPLISTFPSNWNMNVDPSTLPEIMDFTPFLGKEICQDGGDDTVCTVAFAAALKKGNHLVKHDDSLRKSCEFDESLNKKVCYIRKKEGISKKTVFELEFWFDTATQKSKLRYNWQEPH
uniref:Transmembrane protein n=1 Tax=Cacopsylla melanoneura TaxID=428564 RepID=A0A8D9AE77_9HEMI